MSNIFFSEDLTREQKAKRNAERDAAAVDEWESTPIEMRAAPGYQPYPALAHSNKMRGSGRGRGAPGGLLDTARGRAGLGSPYPVPGPSDVLALEFGGGYKQEAGEEGAGGKLSEYYTMMFENITR